MNWKTCLGQTVNKNTNSVPEIYKVFIKRTSGLTVNSHCTNSVTIIIIVHSSVALVDSISDLFATPLDLQLM